MKKSSLGAGAVIKGINLSVIITLVSVLIFAFIIKTASLGGGVIKCVNQFIKVISIFLGCMIFLKGKMGLLKGLLVGFFYAILVHLIFALFGGNFSLSLSFFIDLVFCSCLGLISGIISVNLKKE